LNRSREREEKLIAVLESTAPSFFDPLHQAVGGGYPGETIEALWSLVWRGLITNDSLHALRAYIARPESCANAEAVADRFCFSFAQDYSADCAGALVAAANSHTGS